jgi:hypothetical protein
MSRTTSITPALRDRDGMAVIGRTKQDLMGIRYGEGEVGGAPDPAAVAAAAQAAAAKAAEDAAKPPWGDDPTKFDPDKAWRLIQNVKSDLADQKTKTEAAIAAAATKAAEDAQKATLAQFAKLLGGGEQEETDPVKLAAKVTDLSTQIATKDTDLTKAQADVKAGQLSTAVAILSHGLGANPKLLLANEEFKTSIASVEPTDEAAIQAAITKAIQANAALKATPPRSGSGEHQGATVQSLEALLAQAVKAGDVGEQITIKRRIAEVKAKE